MFPSKLPAYTLLIASVTLISFGAGCSLYSNSVVTATPEGAKMSSESNLKFSIARAKESDDDLLTALDIYRELYTSNPEDPSIAHRLGVTLVRTGEIEEGITYLLEADSMAVRNHEVKTDLGYAYLLSGDFALAEEFLREALNIHPEDERAVNNLALAVGSQGRISEAYSLYKSVMSEAEANSNIAYIHAQRGETDLALARYNSALSVNPKLTNAAEGIVQVLELQTLLAQHSPSTEDKSPIQLVHAESESQE
ncbi:photosystem I assembly protein Ycf3 [Thalassoglobus neptunius]|uniref:Photosystem I assembly protein Ycf3 n=1 Tax=Thalassoglobus neptunius TaxID=1938619 RepID=A0A5C5X1Q4_9PLAN|nr:tetratricopeptide repeat protein [Thalassoglobus neptunius]TWT56846.1 photosystem I assembly protein Ycf3 [Thalassoglobus neptunius]